MRAVTAVSRKLKWSRRRCRPDSPELAGPRMPPGDSDVFFPVDFLDATRRFLAPPPNGLAASGVRPAERRDGYMLLLACRPVSEMSSGPRWCAPAAHASASRPKCWRWRRSLSIQVPLVRSPDAGGRAGSQWSRSARPYTDADDDALGRRLQSDIVNSSRRRGRGAGWRFCPGLSARQVSPHLRELPGDNNVASDTSSFLLPVAWVDGILRERRFTLASYAVRISPLDENMNDGRRRPGCGISEASLRR